MQHRKKIYDAHDSNGFYDNSVYYNPIIYILDERTKILKNISAIAGLLIRVIEEWTFYSGYIVTGYKFTQAKGVKNKSRINCFHE